MATKKTRLKVTVTDEALNKARSVGQLYDILGIDMADMSLWGKEENATPMNIYANSETDNMILSAMIRNALDNAGWFKRKFMLKRIVTQTSREWFMLSPTIDNRVKKNTIVVRF